MYPFGIGPNPWKEIRVHLRAYEQAIIQQPEYVDRLFVKLAGDSDSQSLKFEFHILLESTEINI